MQNISETALICVPVHIAATHAPRPLCWDLLSVVASTIFRNTGSPVDASAVTTIIAPAESATAETSHLILFITNSYGQAAVGSATRRQANVVPSSTSAQKHM